MSPSDPVSKLSSVVILRLGFGKYVASVRFADKRLDEDISATSKSVLYNIIESRINKKLGLYR